MQPVLPARRAGGCAAAAGLRPAETVLSDGLPCGPSPAIGLVFPHFLLIQQHPQQTILSGGNQQPQGVGYRLPGFFIHVFGRF